MGPKEEWSGGGRHSAWGLTIQKNCDSKEAYAGGKDSEQVTKAPHVEGKYSKEKCLRERGCFGRN